MSLQGEGKKPPPVVFEPQVLDFGAVPVGATSDFATATLINRGSETWTIWDCQKFEEPAPPF